MSRVLPLVSDEEEEGEEGFASTIARAVHAGSAPRVSLSAVEKPTVIVSSSGSTRVGDMVYSCGKWQSVNAAQEDSEMSEFDAIVEDEAGSFTSPPPRKAQLPHAWSTAKPTLVAGGSHSGHALGDRGAHVRASALTSSPPHGDMVAAAQRGHSELLSDGGHSSASTVTMLSNVQHEGTQMTHVEALRPGTAGTHFGEDEEGEDWDAPLPAAAPPSAALPPRVPHVGAQHLDGHATRLAAQEVAKSLPSASSTRPSKMVTITLEDMKRVQMLPGAVHVLPAPTSSGLNVHLTTAARTTADVVPTGQLLLSQSDADEDADWDAPPVPIQPRVPVTAPPPGALSPTSTSRPAVEATSGSVPGEKHLRGASSIPSFDEDGEQDADWDALPPVPSVPPRPQQPVSRSEPSAVIAAASAAPARPTLPAGDDEAEENWGLLSPTGGAVALSAHHSSGSFHVHPLKESTPVTAHARAASSLQSDGLAAGFDDDFDVNFAEEEGPSWSAAPASSSASTAAHTAETTAKAGGQRADSGAVATSSSRLALRAPHVPVPLSQTSESGSGSALFPTPTFSPPVSGTPEVEKRGTGAQLPAPPSEGHVSLAASAAPPAGVARSPPAQPPAQASAGAFHAVNVDRPVHDLATTSASAVHPAASGTARPPSPFAITDELRKAFLDSERRHDRFAQAWTQYSSSAVPWSSPLGAPDASNTTPGGHEFVVTPSTASGVAATADSNLAAAARLSAQAHPSALLSPPTLSATAQTVPGGAAAGTPPFTSPPAATATPLSSFTRARAAGRTPTGASGDVTNLDHSAGHTPAARLQGLARAVPPATRTEGQPQGGLARAHGSSVGAAPARVQTGPVRVISIVAGQAGSSAPAVPMQATRLFGHGVQVPVAAVAAQRSSALQAMNSATLARRRTAAAAQAREESAFVRGSGSHPPASSTTASARPLASAAHSTRSSSLVTARNMQRGTAVTATGRRQSAVATVGGRSTVGSMVGSTAGASTRSAAGKASPFVRSGAFTASLRTSAGARTAATTESLSRSVPMQTLSAAIRAVQAPLCRDTDAAGLGALPRSSAVSHSDAHAAATVVHVTHIQPPAAQARPLHAGALHGGTTAAALSPASMRSHTGADTAAGGVSAVPAVSRLPSPAGSHSTAMGSVHGVSGRLGGGLTAATGEHRRALTMSAAPLDVVSLSADIVRERLQGASTGGGEQSAAAKTVETLRRLRKLSMSNPSLTLLAAEAASRSPRQVGGSSADAHSDAFPIASASTSASVPAPVT